VKLPPLAPLRAFEAAARHLSFTRAAEELHVTQGAISQQVKQLEEYLGFALFHRRPRKLALTAEGGAFQEVVGNALRQISDKAESLKSSRDSGPVTVSVVPSFAAKWLIPRLTAFRQAHPDIPVRVDANHDRVDLRDGEVDLAVRFTWRKFPDLHSVELFRDRVFPVCSPDLVREGRAPRTLEDLANVVLLHDNATMWDESACDWEYWARAVGLKNIDVRSGPGFTQGDMVLQAAMLGDGVALTRSSLAELDLASGRLVKPLDISIPCPWAHYVVCLEESLDRPNIRAFYDWLLAEGSRVAPVYDKS
jgi:LysR family glycine cleavage system transcriptional activator